MLDETSAPRLISILRKLTSNPWDVRIQLNLRDLLAQPPFGAVQIQHKHKESRVAVPISQMMTVSKYVLTQKLRGVKRYPLVLMLEPLFRCNLACAGCGKIQYPDH